jgi:hypothetical protein
MKHAAPGANDIRITWAVFIGEFSPSLAVKRPDNLHYPRRRWTC